MRFIIVDIYAYNIKISIKFPLLLKFFKHGSHSAFADFSMGRVHNIKIYKKIVKPKY